jgi:hypothetical protein
MRSLYTVFSFSLLISVLMASCTTVKPYQRAYVNDENMKLGKRSIDSFDDNIHAYREGSAGAGGKASGGCGCN